MKVLNRTVTLRQLVLVAVVALTVGVGGSAVAATVGKEAALALQAKQANLGTVDGFTYKSNTRNILPESQRFVQVQCPDAKHATGGGVFSSGGYNESTINSTYPIDDGDSDLTPDDGWGGYVDNYIADAAVTARAYVICK